MDKSYYLEYINLFKLRIIYIRRNKNEGGGPPIMNAKERIVREMNERGFVIDPVRVDETEDPYEIERRSNELFRNDDMYRWGAEFDSVIRYIDVEDPQEQGYILTGLYTSMLADYDRETNTEYWRVTEILVWTGITNEEIGILLTISFGRKPTNLFVGGCQRWM